MPQGAVSAADGAEGVLDFLDNTVDTASGTILLKAKFPNKNRQLWPGQFVNVSVRLANPTETVVPSSAVRTAQQGSYVFVVKPDSTAEQRTIETARSFDELTVVQSGLKPGEKVIVEGQLRSEARLESQDPATQRRSRPSPYEFRLVPAGLYERDRVFYPAVDHHNAINGGDQHFRRDRLLWIASQRSAGGGFPDDFG